jgi:hypothetical protein
MIAAARRKRWGAWTVFLSPIVSLTGLAFTNNTDWEQALIATAITVGPAVFIGAILLKAIGPRTTSVESNTNPS